MGHQSSDAGPEWLSDGLDAWLAYGPSLDDDAAWGEPPDEDLLSEEPELPDDAYDDIAWFGAPDTGSGFGPDAGRVVGLNPGSDLAPSVRSDLDPDARTDLGPDARSALGPEPGSDLGLDAGSDLGLDADPGLGPDGASDLDAAAGSVADRFEQALQRLAAAADDLVTLGTDPDLVLADRDRVMGWARQLELTHNKLACPDQALINLMEAAGCRIDGPLSMFDSPRAFLHALHQIRWGEARARVRAAQQLAPTMTMDGRRIDPQFPVLAAAQETGDISPDRIDQSIQALLEWQKLADTGTVTAEDLTAAEEMLADRARVFGGPQLAAIIDQIGAHLNPDGILDDPAAQDAVRTFDLRPVSRGLHRGMYRAEGWLTAETGAQLATVLDPLSKPQPVTDDAGRVIEPDRRDRGMRLHDALHEVADRALRAGDLPAHGGTPTTLIITADAQDVIASTGTGVTETGDKLPMEAVIALADEAEIVRTVFHQETRELLYLGRSRRLATYAQTLALAARDGGCTFPGCTKSPKWCQRHHILDWIKGGNTDLPNLALLCAFHHYRFARHGWTAEYANGRVWWRPPKIIDPDQKPILNTHHRAHPLT